MRDHVGACEKFVLRRRLVEQQGFGFVGDVARVFRGARLERRDQHEVELAEGIRDAGITFQRLEGLRVQIEQHVAVAPQLGSIVLAMEHAHGAARTRRRLDLHVADHPRHHVGGQRLGRVKADPDPIPGRVPVLLGAVGHRLPLRRVFQRDGPSALEIGLIETRYRPSCIRRHEPGVEEVVAAVEWCIAGTKGNAHRVLAAAQRRRRDHEMPVDRACGHRDAVGSDGRLRRALGVEVDYQGLGSVGSRKRSTLVPITGCVWSAGIDRASS